MKGILIWAGVMVLVAIGLSFLVTQDQVYKGTDLEFTASTSRNLTVNSSSEVTFEGASSNFFLLRKLSGETIVATPTNPPLGWDSDTYFTAGPTIMTSGNWIIESGSATVHLTSNQTVTVTAYDNNKPMTWLLMFVVAFCIWLLGILITQ